MISYIKFCEDKPMAKDNELIPFSKSNPWLHTMISYFLKPSLVTDHDFIPF